MLNATSPFETSREAATTDDCQWLIDCYLGYLRRPGHRRYGGGGDTPSGPPPPPPPPEEWQNPETSSDWLNPETGLPWLNPDQ